MDVLFVDVPKDFRFPESSWHLGYRSMISVLRAQGFTADLLYPKRSPHVPTKTRMIGDILKSQAKIVGFTTYDIELSTLLAFIKELRQAGLQAHITLGGLCASAIPTILINRVRTIDSVIAGEGEEAVIDLANFVIRGQGKPPMAGVHLRQAGAAPAPEARPLIADLDALPAPAGDHLDPSDPDSPVHYVNGCAPLIASKGCYGNCTFCCIQRFYRARAGQVWRGRDPLKIAREGADLIRKTGLSKLTFVDENFMGPGLSGRQHAAQVAQQIKQQGLAIPFNFGCRPNDVDRPTMQLLKEAGLAAVTLGIESMSPEALRLFNKHTTPQINAQALATLEDLQIFTEITFIFFHPLTTLTEIRDNVGFIERVRTSRYAYFNNDQPFTGFVPFFGTELTADLEHKGLAKRSLNGFSTRYADPHAGYIARRLLAFPIEHLIRLKNSLPAGGSHRLVEMKEKLGSYQLYLSMQRLPALVSDYCDLFERGASVSSRSVRQVSAAIDQEVDSIVDLVQRFSEHTHGPAHRSDLPL